MILIFLKNLLKKQKKAVTLKNAIILPNGRQKVLNAFESGIFPKIKQGKGLTRISDCVRRVPRVAKISDHNYSFFQVKRT